MDKIVQSPLVPTQAKIANNTETEENVTHEDEGSIIEDKVIGEKASDQEVLKVIEVEILHRDCSQEVKGAIPSPKEAYQLDKIVSITLDDGSQLIVEEEKSPEHTDTAVTESASETEKDVVQGSPSSISQDLTITPGQNIGNEMDKGNNSTEAMETEIENSSGQLGSLVAQMRGSLTPLTPSDSGTKRQQLQGMSTDDSDNGFKTVGIGPGSKSPTNRSKKKSRPEDKSKTQS